jgi:hypothetical protein
MIQLVRVVFFHARMEECVLIYEPPNKLGFASTHAKIT